MKEFVCWACKKTFTADVWGPCPNCTSENTEPITVINEHEYRKLQAELRGERSGYNQSEKLRKIAK